MDSESTRHHLGLGDLLMGRYRLDAELFTNLPQAQRFRATDNILSRQAEVHLLTGPHTEDAVDAARRAALVEDPRIVRIIDAGRYSGVSFVLTAPLDGVSLADVGPLPAAQARAVAGEVATALAGAAARDVHHLALRPELVFLGQGDTVRIGGMAWDAAQRGVADLDAATSSEIDAIALVSILYAALTARWPGETPSVMPPPPLWDANPVAPIELVSGVPGDLSTLCAVALAAAGAGPVRADQVASDLGVWPPVRINLPYSASVRGPIPRAVTPPKPLRPDLDSPDDPDSTGPDSSAAADDTAPWKAGAEPLRPTEADVAALATQAVIQDQVAALEAIVVPPSAEADAEAARRWSLGEFAPPDEALYWDQHHDEAPDRPDQADHDHDRTTPTDYADVHQDAERPEEEIGATASQDGPGDGDGRNADAVALDWPAAQVTPPPALSSLAEQLDPVPPAAATIIVHAAAEPVEFALPPLPEDLADVLAAAPPLNEAAPPYEPVAVAEVDEDATLVLEPINEDIEPIRPPVVRERPPNRAKQSLDGELAKPVSHDQTPPGLDDEQVGQALSGLTPPNTRPPVDLLAAATLTGGATGGGAISGDLSSQAAEPPGFDPATVPPELNAPPVRPAADTLDAASGPETTGANVLSVPTAGAPAVAAGGGPGASDPPHGAQQLFDVEPPSFDNVLAGDSAPAPAKRNWWPLVTFIAVAVACVSLGLLILQQVGVLSLGAVGTSVWPQPAGPAAVG